MILRYYSLEKAGSLSLSLERQTAARIVLDDWRELEKALTFLGMQRT